MAIEIGISAVNAGIRQSPRIRNRSLYSWRRISREMLGHLPLRQAKAPGNGIDMPLRAGMARKDLEEIRFSR
jgi:hypothetical protein